MKLIDQLTEKPWLPISDGVAALDRHRTFGMPKARLALRVLLSVVTVMFSLFIIAYADRMTFPDWRPVPEPWLLWVNTAVMVFSSVMIQRARKAAYLGREKAVRQSMLAAGALAFTFLAGQLVVWKQLANLGYFVETNPAASFFYLVTALHGLHLLGGLVAWFRTNDNVRRGKDVAELSLSIDLCAVYWHFLLFIWLVLFGLLLFT